MSGTVWGITMAAIYLVLVLTIAVLTFRKGHWILGLFGFVFPVLWLIGAILPARRYR
jgi:choline-glycine betaine transporter